LAGLKKGDDRKPAIAAMIRSSAAVPNAWIAAELALGHISHVSPFSGAYACGSTAGIGELPMKQREFIASTPFFRKKASGRAYGRRAATVSSSPSSRSTVRDSIHRQTFQKRAHFICTDRLHATATACHVLQKALDPL